MDSTDYSGTRKMKNSPLISPHYVLMMTGRMMPLLALFAATILYVHALAPEDYALFQSVWMYLNIVSVILGFGVTTIIFSSQTSELVQFLKSNKKLIIGFYTFLWVITLLGFALASHQYSFMVKVWVIAFMISQASNTILETWLIKNGGEVRYFTINAIYSIAFIIGHYIVLQSGFRLELLVQVVLLISVLKLLALYFSSRRIMGGLELKVFPSEFRQHWIYNGLNDVIGVFSKWIDKLILIYLLTPAEFAIFFNGSIEIPLFSIFISFTGSLMMVQMATKIKEGHSIAPVFRENFLLLSTISFPLFFFLFFFSTPIFLIVFGPHYEESVPVFLITILILPLRINTYGAILQVNGKGKTVTIGSVLDLGISTILVLLLYPWLGMQGAALALVISTLIQISFYLWKSQAILHESFLHLVPVLSLLIRFVICGVLFWILQHYIRQLSDVIEIIAGIILMIMCIAAAGWKYFTQILRTEKSQQL